MKSIDEIEKISFEELEAIASDRSVKAPEALAAGVRETVAAAAVREGLLRKRAGTAIAIAVPSLVAAAVALALLLPSNSPQDTFDDPLLAYAEVERIMGYISERTEEGMSKTAKLAESVESINVVLEKLK